MRMIAGFIFAALLVIFSAQAVWAQDDALSEKGLSTHRKEPIVIDAQKTMEWHRNDNRFIATGDVVASQGASSVRGQTLTADYRKGQTSSMEIYKMRAEGDVVLSSQDSKAYGDVAVYDLDAGLATLTGEGLKLVSPDQTVTADERFEYYVAEGRVNAIGRAKVVRPKPEGGGVDTLEADEISALFKENAQGQRVLDILEAKGHVVITTPSEVIRGAYAIYRSGTNKAEMSGGVKIERGPNILEGARADVDLTTNISRIFGDGSSGTSGDSSSGASSQGGRVRGVFYPDSQDTP
ncbi:MAG: ostA-like family protein [Alphaproteobacteria bacterium]|nr:ostA-like family protein [Alphaproteobacteria bacterium]